MKKKLLLVLFILSLSLAVKGKNIAEHSKYFPGIKNYEKISLVEVENATLSWIEAEKIEDKEFFDSSQDNEHLKLISSNDELKVKKFKDDLGHEIVLIEGQGEVLFLFYNPREVNNQHNLLEFKVEDRIISQEQLDYVRKIVNIRDN